MVPDWIELLRCPYSGGPLQLLDPEFEGKRIKQGMLVSPEGKRYLIRDFIPRFVPESTYADSFGFQWNRFRRTQLDSYTGQPISAERFYKATGWQPEELKGSLVLDVGCGAGRFAEVALTAGAKVVAIDYSNAVDACYANLGHHPDLLVIQADIYALPFRHGLFDFVYSLGVLQHTPDAERAFKALPPMLKSGGRLCVDVYERSWESLFHPKYWLRPFTKRLSKDFLLKIVESSVPFLLPISRAVGSLPLFGSFLKRLVPVANYYGVYQLGDDALYEWAVLDTFDWLSPTYDKPQTRKTLRRWLEEAGLKNIEVVEAGHLVGRGSKS
jgi:SAM-dependent methyltransferase